MRRVDKPWGHELVWAESARYVGKILHIHAGHRLSRQYHQVKEETFMVQAGEMDLEVGLAEAMETRRMKVGDVFHVLPGTVHRMLAVTDVDVLEVSTPELDDVVRLERLRPRGHERGVSQRARGPDEDHEPR
jgi:mannose-6-phosphate isomerase